MAVDQAGIVAPDVAGFLRRYARRRQRLAAVRAGAMVLALSLAWVLLWCGVDRLFGLPGWARLSLLAVHVVGALALLSGPVTRLLRRRVDWLAVAEDVERRCPQLNERLRTVVAQVREQDASPLRSRSASGEMLDHLLTEVAAVTAARRVTQLLPLRELAGWTAIALLLAGVWSGLGQWEWLGLHQLAQRYALPLGNTPMVTASRLSLALAAEGGEPGASPLRVEQGGGVRVAVEARRVGEGRVWLHTSHDGRTWVRREMTEVPSGVTDDGSRPTELTAHDSRHFDYHFEAVERDLWLYATGGDGRSRTAQVRVLDRPVIDGFRIAYSYPDHTGREPLVVSNRSGLIDAPAGSQAKVTILASRPLAECQVEVGEEMLEAVGGGDGREWIVRIPVAADGQWRVRMRSVDGVKAVSGDLEVRAAPDRAPLVRLFQPTDDVRLHPRDVVSVVYQALDDYGVAALSLHGQVNDEDEQVWWLAGPPARETGPQTRLEETWELDLAGLELGVGDVLSLWLVAEDSAGQRTASDVRHVLISPRSIDIDRYLLIRELRESAALADEAMRSLREAERAYRGGEPVNGGAPTHQLTDSPTHRLTRIVRELSDAEQVTDLLRQGLLRALVLSDDAALATALAGLLDELQWQLWFYDEVIPLLWVYERMEEATEELGPLSAEAVRSARRLMDHLGAIAAGEQAAAIVAELENLAALEQRSAQAAQTAPHLERTMARVHEDVMAAMMQLEIDPAGDVERSLQQHIERRQRLLDEYAPVDYVAAAEDWSAQLRSGGSGSPFTRRLAMGAEAQAYRRDTDMVRARDLELSRRAAVAIEAWMAADDDSARAAAGEYPGVLRVLLERDDPVQETERAREMMKRWAAAAEAQPAPASPIVSPAGEAHRLALEASAETTLRNYDRAGELDEQFLELVAGLERAGQVLREPLARLATTLHDRMDQARQLDEAQRRQVALLTETAQAGAETDPRQAQALAERQQDVADRIGDVAQRRQRYGQMVLDEPLPGEPAAAAGREQALARILHAQQRLARLPEQLAEVERLSALHTASVDRLRLLRYEMDMAPATQRWTAERMVREAERQADHAQQRLAAASREVNPEVTYGLVVGLEGYSPETDAAVWALEQDLTPWLGALQQALYTTGRGEIGRSTTAARLAIERAQSELRRAQETIVEQDPLVAARWFAREAALALAERPPALELARRQQEQTVQALSQAWQTTVREMATQRLAATPQGSRMSGVAAADWPDDPRRGGGSGQAATEGMVEAGLLDPTRIPYLAARQWGRVRLRDAPPHEAVRRELDPPGYSEAIRLYFEAIGRGGIEAAKREPGDD